MPDGTIYRALDKLLVLDGERISYRALDVEQIGSVHETMMGFRLRTAIGPAVAVRSQSRHGAPTAVDLDALLAIEPAGRAKWMTDHSHRKLTPKLIAAVKDAASLRGPTRRAGGCDRHVSDWTVRDTWDEAQTELAQVRLFGDLVVAAFFSGAKPKEREAKRLD